MRDLDRILRAVFVDSPAADEALTMDMRHIVVTTDPYTGGTMCIGPFDRAVDACVFAEQHSRSLVDDEYPEPLRALVVPLVPPG